MSESESLSAQREASKRIDVALSSLRHPPFSALLLAQSGRPWTSESQEITKFRAWCLKHPRKCRKLFRFSPNPRMSAVQFFHTALHGPFSINPVRTLEGNAWTVLQDDRAVIQDFLGRILVGAAHNAFTIGLSGAIASGCTTPKALQEAIDNA